MPLTDSFLLSTNDTLTVEFSGVYNLVHQTDGSDNPQVKTLWLGSLFDYRKLSANSNPGVDSISISVVDSLPIWQASHAYAEGDCVQPTVSNGKRYKCIATGTSGASQPTWPTTAIGNQVSDGTVMWQLQANKHTTSEITLALTEEDLETNTPGASLNLGTLIEGGVANKVEIWIQIENALTTVTNTGIIPDISLAISALLEEEV